MAEYQAHLADIPHAEGIAMNMTEKMDYSEVRKFAYEHGTRNGSNAKLFSRTLWQNCEVSAALSLYDMGKVELNVKWFCVVCEGVEFYTEQDIDELDLVTVEQHCADFADFNVQTSRLDKLIENEQAGRIQELLDCAIPV